MNFDVVAIGDYALDVILNIPPDFASCRIEDNKKNICLGQDEKILCDKFSLSIGGNACNVAVGLSRLGNKCALKTFIGDDFTKEMFRNAMCLENVDLSLSSKRNQMAANYSTSLFFQKEKSIFIYNPNNIYELGDIGKPKLIFISSVGPNFENFFNQVAEYAKKFNIILAFNPASHQLYADVSSYQNIIMASNYLFVNKKEAGKILNNQTQDIKQLLIGLTNYCSGVIILTDRANGSYTISNGKTLYCPILDLPVVQKTGAGDAFTSGYLGAILYGVSKKDALLWGTINAAIVIGNKGSLSGLQTKDQILRLISQHPEIIVQEI